MPETSAAPNFDFVTAKAFRRSLEADYAEMLRCQGCGAWKSVQVLAGSIVEALLVDYLAAVSHPNRASKDPLRFDLGQAIALCKEEKAVSERTADLCSVIRSYRNLIHPGRMLRLQEPAPNEKSAAVAVALVGIIAEELARVRRAAVGLTAEQIVSKIQRDASTLTVLKHLLAEVSDDERERLLLTEIPNAYFEVWDSTTDIDPFDEYLPRLERAYAIVFDSSAVETRQRAALEFVRSIREDDGHRVEARGYGFFRPTHMQYLPQQYWPLVRTHLLGRLPQIHDLRSLRLIDGIEPYLTPEDVGKWLAPYLRTLRSPVALEAVKKKAQTNLLWSAVEMLDEVSAKAQEHMQRTIKHYEDHGATDDATKLAEIAKAMKEMLI